MTPNQAIIVLVCPDCGRRMYVLLSLPEGQDISGLSDRYAILDRRPFVGAVSPHPRTSTLGEGRTHHLSMFGLRRGNLTRGEDGNALPFSTPMFKYYFKKFLIRFAYVLMAVFTPLFIFLSFKAVWWFFQ